MMVRGGTQPTVPTVRCADVDEQEHPAGAEAPGPSASAATPPVTEPATPRPEQQRWGEGARKALTSRGAGWVAAAILAGAVVAFLVVPAPAPTVLLPGAARSFRVGPAGGRTEIVSPPPGALRTSWVQVPAGAPLRTSWVEVPANAPPRGIQVVLPANARPRGVMVQV